MKILCVPLTESALVDVVPLPPGFRVLATILLELVFPIDWNVANSVATVPPASLLGSFPVRTRLILPLNCIEKLPLLVVTLLPAGVVVSFTGSTKLEPFSFAFADTLPVNVAGGR